MRTRVGALLGALLVVLGTGGAAVALLRVADRHDRQRSNGPGRESTTAPSAALDRDPSSPPPPPPPPPAPAPTTPTTEDRRVVLSGDGVGEFRFGVEPDRVIAGLTLRWGPPDGDTGWVPAGGSPYGACPGTVVRGVEWRGFTVLFSDGATPRGPAGVRHFFTWEYQVADPGHPARDPGGDRPALMTATGASVGVTVKALQRAYGSALELFDEPPGGPQFGVQTSLGGLFGSLTGLDPAGVVRTIVSGGGCGE